MEENKKEMAHMDEAAKTAAAQFPATGTAQDVAAWWKKWYPVAGHKRLGRVLAAQVVKVEIHSTASTITTIPVSQQETKA